MNFNKLITISLEGDLKECIELMKQNKIHRVIIEDNKSSTYTGFVTYESIFEYFSNNYYSDMIAFNINLSDLNISSQKIIKADKNDTIYNCFILFYIHNISIIPIMDDEKLFGFLYLKDVIYFFSNGEKFSVFITFNLSLVILSLNLFLIYMME